jgi:parvulin-like peptidyl-prolyl isomerase
LTWFPQDFLARSLGESIAQQSFAMAVGERSQPIPSDDGYWYVIEVLGREERPLDDYIFGQVADEAFQVWLDAQQVLVERGSYRDRIPTDP